MLDGALWPLAGAGLASAFIYTVGLSWVISILVGSITAIRIFAPSPWINRVVLKTADVSRSISVGASAMFFAAFPGALSCKAFNVIALGNFIRGGAIVLLVTAGAALGRVRGAAL